MTLLGGCSDIQNPVDPQDSSKEEEDDTETSENSQKEFEWTRIITDSSQLTSWHVLNTGGDYFLYGNNVSADSSKTYYLFSSANAWQNSTPGHSFSDLIMGNVLYAYTTNSYQAGTTVSYSTNKGVTYTALMEDVGVQTILQGTGSIDYLLVNELAGYENKIYKLTYNSVQNTVSSSSITPSGEVKMDKMVAGAFLLQGAIAAEDIVIAPDYSGSLWIVTQEGAWVRQISTGISGAEAKMLFTDQFGKTLFFLNGASLHSVLFEELLNSQEDTALYDFSSYQQHLDSGTFGSGNYSTAAVYDDANRSVIICYYPQYKGFCSMTTTDGKNYTIPQGAGAEDTILGTRKLNGKYYVYGDDVYESADGLTWSSLEHPYTSSYITSKISVLGYQNNSLYSYSGNLRAYSPAQTDEWPLVSGGFNGENDSHGAINDADGKIFIYTDYWGSPGGVFTLNEEGIVVNTLETGVVGMQSSYMTLFAQYHSGQEYGFYLLEQK